MSERATRVLLFESFAVELSALYGNSHLVMQHPQLWYRRTTWTAADRDDFFARLKRARRKAEYLSLQAFTLVDTGEPSLVGVGLELIDQMITHYPEPFFLSNAYLTRADALVKLGRPEEAVMAFRGALNAHRTLPNVINDAYLEFAWTVARLGLRQFFDEAISVLHEFQQSSDLDFPTNEYRYCGAIALILADRGDLIEARKRARMALQAVAETHGPFSRHPSLGVVDATQLDPVAHKRLWSLAAV